MLQQIDQIANGLIEADPTSSRNKTFSEPSDGTSRLQIHLLTEPVIQLPTLGVVLLTPETNETGRQITERQIVPFTAINDGLKINGGSDGTRTRGLRRDRPAL